MSIPDAPLSGEATQGEPFIAFEPTQSVDECVIDSPPGFFRFACN